MAEAAHDVFAGLLARPSVFRHPENSGGVSCRHVFLRAEFLHLHPTRINVRMFICLFCFFFLFAVYSVMFSSAVITLRRLLLIINARFAVFSLFAAVCCGRRDQLKESGHVRSAPWTSTAMRQSYYVQFRQEAGTAGAVASDGDLATNSQIVGSEGSTARLEGPRVD
jgi:hypothetical protein